MPQMIELFLSAKAQEAASSPSMIVGFRNAKDDEPAEIMIDGEIGDPWEQNDSRSVGQFLRANKGRPVKVWINSPGGLAYDGITMHNALVQHDAPVTTVIAGIAGSAASIIAMAGNPVQMYENANLFIHRASLVAVGNEDVMEEAKDWLHKIDDSIARTYKAKNGMELQKIKSLMRGKVDGTVFTASEAKKGKWIDEVVSPAKKAQASSTRVTTHLREAFAAMLGDGRFTSQCSCAGDTKRAVVAFGSKLAQAHMHSEICPVRAEFNAGFGEFESKHAGLDMWAAIALKARMNGTAKIQKLEAQRAERIRSRREMFAPAE